MSIALTLVASILVITTQEASACTKQWYECTDTANNCGHTRTTTTLAEATGICTNDDCCSGISQKFADGGTGGGKSPLYVAAPLVLHSVTSGRSPLKRTPNSLIYFSAPSSLLLSTATTNNAIESFVCSFSPIIPLTTCMRVSLQAKLDFSTYGRAAAKAILILWNTSTGRLTGTRAPAPAPRPQTCLL